MPRKKLTACADTSRDRSTKRMNSTLNTASAATIEIDQSGNIVRCGGPWVLGGIPNLEYGLAALSGAVVKSLQFDVAAVTAMDTAGAWLLQRTIRRLESNGCSVMLQGQRPELEALLSVVKPVDLSTDSSPPPPSLSLLEKIGRAAWPHLQQVVGMLAFLGEISIVVLRSVIQPSRIRWRPVLYNLQHAGFRALPIVGLLAFLLGVVISYQGAGQLQRYGANIFIADLVGLSMLRELAPLMTAIIVAGRSGSAFAAQIGTMKVTEEIDALRTIGISPIELLVLPKVLALVVALPLLSFYADMMGVLGGMVMAKSQLGVSYADFMDRLSDAVNLSALMVGIGKAPIFAAIIALVGCFQGFQVGNGADSVGDQTTISVVQAIFLIIVADALFSVVFSWLHI
jgi:phospholipid/cholesterol/gamma-HCH transport system permease protein